jgi:membrane protein
MNFLSQPSQSATSLLRTMEMRARRFRIMDILFQTAHAYSTDHCATFAAALSYYALLSIFPLMLFLLAMIDTFGVKPDTAVRYVTSFMGNNLPISATVLRDSLQQVSALGFIWSATGVFEMLQLSISRAFRVQQPRPLWRRRLTSLAMVLGVSVIFGLSMLLTTSIRLGVHYGVVQRHDLFTEWLPPILATILSALVLGMLYRYIPNDRSIRWRHVWIPALTAAILWEIAKLIFSWYLTNYALLNMVYGSLGTVVAIMLWGYTTAVILLFGAEATAVIVGAREHERTGTEWWGITG